jgi:hypothetical protein
MEIGVRVERRVEGRGRFEERQKHGWHRYSRDRRAAVATRPSCSNTVHHRQIILLIAFL